MEINHAVPAGLREEGKTSARIGAPNGDGGAQMMGKVMGRYGVLPVKL